jgi:hypothetical protein
LECNRFAEAEQEFGKSIEIRPPDEYVNRGLSTIYREMGQDSLAQLYSQKADRLGEQHCNQLTFNNFRKLKRILDRRKIRLVCMQYPVRGVAPLKKIFEGNEYDVIFVDNERIFKDAISKDGYKEYFIDMFGIDFGHCTPKGNRLLAHNLAEVIVHEVFKK